MTENPVACEILLVIRFLSNKDIIVAEINGQIRQVLEQIIMTGGMVRGWVGNC